MTYLGVFSSVSFIIISFRFLERPCAKILSVFFSSSFTFSLAVCVCVYPLFCCICGHLFHTPGAKYTYTKYEIDYLVLSCVSWKQIARWERGVQVVGFPYVSPAGKKHGAFFSGVVGV